MDINFINYLNKIILKNSKTISASEAWDIAVIIEKVAKAKSKKEIKQENNAF